MNVISALGTKIIQFYFPELEPKNIDFYVRKTAHKGMIAFQDYRGKEYCICTDSRIVALPEPILKGWLGHELSHCALWEKEKGKKVKKYSRI